MKLNGRVGQVRGPFAAGDDLIAEGGAISEFTPEVTKPNLYKLGIQTDTGTMVQINHKLIKVGFTGIYELDEVVNITSLIFPDGAGENTLVDFVY